VSWSVFETFNGLPLHPLVVHAAVVFIPLLIAAVLAYAFVPRVRSRVDWLVVGLAVVAPLTALTAKITGDAFRAREVRRHTASPSVLAKIDHHRLLGTWTLYVTIALGLVALALVLVRRRPVAVSALLVVAALGLSVAGGILVYLTGDSAAKIVWTGM
jgi:uncharacterized membrane protein